MILLFLLRAVRFTLGSDQLRNRWANYIHTLSLPLWSLSFGHSPYTLKTPLPPWRSHSANSRGALQILFAYTPESWPNRQLPACHSAVVTSTQQPLTWANGMDEIQISDCLQAVSTENLHEKQGLIWSLLKLVTPLSRSTSHYSQARAGARGAMWFA